MHPLGSLLLVSVLAVVCGCGPVDEELLAPDAGRGGAPGAQGPFGVLRTTRDLTSARGTVTADVYRPFLDDATPPPAPLFVFVQGGLVDAARYRWVAAHVASRGSVAIVPHHVLDLAFFAQDTAAQAVFGAREASADEHDALAGLIAPGPGVIAGHSLGGVVAAKAWKALGESEVKSLALLASEPDPADDFGGRIGRVLSIVGSRDRKETVAKAVAGAARMPSATVVVVDGMNHYQLTDDASDGELASDGVPTVKTAAAQTRVLTFVDALVDEMAGTPYPFADPSSWPGGVAPP